MKRFTRNLISITAAAVVGCTAVLNCGLPAELSAAAYQAEEAGKLVPVIVRLSGEAVLAGAEAAELGTDFLDTAEADAKSAALRRISSEAEASLRALYPGLEICYRYDLLMNGFSCELPAGLLDKAESCRWVESITKVETVNVLKPELYTAPDLAEVGYFGETTGYFGEGEVIAVLDSEFDITHSMFAPIDDKENKLTKEDIRAVSGDLNVAVDPDKAYISSKLPYVIDYADDTPYEYASPELYHGTHVAGIAAGDKISDAEGNELSGIARDAQLVLMKVFEKIVTDEESGMYFSTVESNVLLAALEDAAKLKADVVNLSLGSDEPDLDSILYKDTITALNNAGIMVVAAAGNNSNNLIESGVYYNMDTSVPDTHTVGEPSAFREALSVAAANNSFRRDPCFLIEGLEDEIPFCEAEGQSLSDSLPDDVYEYVCCGTGLPEDFEGKDLTGKIALVDRGDLEFWEKGFNAQTAGAIAMIVCNDVDEETLVTMVMDGLNIPSVFISLNDGEKMKAAESGKIRLDSTISVVTPLDGWICAFSSFGPASDLTLKPDITGIGGSVSSAAYDNKLKQLDGTSMASPYVAGCAAILDQYIRKNGVELTGAEKTAFIKNLMMNAAVLYTNGDVYESPRRQGAGLVNLKNVLNDRVILTGVTGLAKVELRDKITDQLSFDVDIRNFTDEDVAFSEAKLILTAEDGGLIEGDESGQMTICGASNIGVTADLSALLNAKAQETRTVTVNAQLSAADLEARETIFPNGFFVEGYLILSGAENCCDISIPVMGFYGDWAKVPIFHNGTQYLEPYRLDILAGEGTFDASNSFAGVAEALAQLIDRLPAEDAEQLSAEPYSLLMYYDDEYFDALLDCPSEGVYLSPDGDGMAEQVSIMYSLQRSAHVSGIKIYDSSSKLISETPEDEMGQPAHMIMGCFSEAELKDCPEGMYKGVLEAYVYYDGADQNPQTYEFPIVIDRTAPALSVNPKEENGRKLLEITSSDDNLDGIYIMGRGNGGIAGEYSAESPQLAEMTNFMSVIDGIHLPIMEYINPVHSDVLVINSIMKSADAYEQNILGSYNFSDILPAYKYQGEDGSVSVTYDVTDLEEYTVTAMDKAFNAAEIMSDDRDSAHLRAGLWWAKNGGTDDAYYNFWDVMSGNIYYQSGAPEKNFTFTLDGDTITMEVMSETSSETRTGTLSFTDKKNAVIAWDNGVTEKLFYYSPDGIAGLNYITTPEMKEIVTAYHNAHNQAKAASAEVAYDENGLGIVRILDQTGRLIAEYTGFDRFENTAVDPEGKPVKFEYIRKGVYRVFQDPETSEKHYYILFTDDGRAVLYSAEEGLEWDRPVEYGGNVITCSKGNADELKVSVTYDNLSTFTVTLGDGSEYYIFYDPNITADNFRVYSTSELEKMAADYCERTYGKRPELVSALFDDDGYRMEFSDGQIVTGDPLGAAGFDYQDQVGFELTDLPEICDIFEAGLWCSKTGEQIKYYSSDGKGTITVTDSSDGAEETIKYHWIGTKAVELTAGDQTETVIAVPFTSEEYDRAIEIRRADDQVEILTFAGEKPLSQTAFYTDQKLTEMAAADRSKKTGKPAAVSETVCSEDGTVVIKFDDGAEYKVDRFTGKGTDENGNAVNLPQTGNNDLSSAGAAAGAGILIFFGAAAVWVSGAFRRKEKR
ncbi:MAG: S8 family serine peptidase [Oscillospiraceae bacterium]|nr:S8 family serine peptidase [Oscillospiraceae bacterium]MBR3448769.1 S8 family serine peptidase [Oscillospiraceae bacterium]